MSQGTESQQTATTKARYDRIAPIYDLMEALPERQFRSWREKLWAQVPEGRVLEVGVGTGKNIPNHRPGVEVVGIDISQRMLQRAQHRVDELGKTAELHQMDAQHLDFPDDSFDAAVATFVFCSVPDAVQGLRELGRVVKPDGKIVLLEHVRVNKPEVIGRVMDLLDPMVVRLMGPHINRRTEENVHRAGLEVERVEALAPLDLVKLIVARPATPMNRSLTEQRSRPHTAGGTPCSY